MAGYCNYVCTVGSIRHGIDCLEKRCVGTTTTESTFVFTVFELKVFGMCFHGECVSIFVDKISVEIVIYLS